MKRMFVKAWIAGFAIIATTVITAAGAGATMTPTVQAGSAVTWSSGHAAVTSCTGHTRASASSRDVAEVFFYTRAGCIGSVTEIVHYTGRSCKTWHIRIYHGNSTHPELTATLRNVCEPAGFFHSTAPIHRTFPNPIRVCAGATNTPGFPCKTVN